MAPSSVAGELRALIAHAAGWVHHYFDLQVLQVAFIIGASRSRSPTGLDYATGDASEFYLCALLSSC